jgi:1,4-alpha-glucan branching enzyme
MLLPCTTTRRHQIHPTNEPVKKETFQVIAPDAEEVLLLGTFTNWEEDPILLRHQNDGIWRISVPLAAGRYEYRFMVDGQWHDDTKCTAHAPNPFGTQNCVRDVAP